MNPIPWRVRAALSDRFPLAYHLLANCVTPRRDAGYWDERLAATWDRRTWPTKNELIASRITPEAAVLDLACGNGSTLRDLKARRFRNLSGMEISEYAVNRLREEGIIMFHGKLPHVPVGDASYDVVIASQVLEHIIRRDLFLSEIARVLKPGGQAFIFVPNNCLGPIDEPEHVTKFDALSFEVLLARHFSVSSIEVMKDANYTMSILLGHVTRPAIQGPV